MLPARRLAYDFLALPSHMQMSIGRQLGLLGPDEGESDVDAFVRWFRELKAQGRMGIFREAVDQQMAELLRYRTPEAARG
jgi:hypothetical protein